MKRVSIVCIIICLTFLQEVSAQCAMCRTQLENNITNGDTGIAAGINTGILYLLSIPYLAAIIIGYMWYKTSRNARKDLSGGVAAG